MELSVLHMGGTSEQARALQAAMNRRLTARDLANLKVKEDGVVGAKTLSAVRTCAWALGAMPVTLETIRRDKVVPIGVSSMIRNPGKRTPSQTERGQKRIANMRKQRKRRAAVANTMSAKRKAICNEARRSRANYRKNPGAYHYLAGGKPNTVVMEPTPRNWRSDCSQWAVNIYRHAGVPCPGSGTYMFSNTLSIEGRGARVVSNPMPGDLGMYGAHGRTHHVELYIGNGEFIGHGTQPIDSITPGLPDFYLSFID